MPVSTGGKIRSLNDALIRIENGQKVVINTLAIENKNEVNKIAKTLGSQALIASIDYIKIDKNNYQLLKTEIKF